jgi:uncharacterized membrane protein
MSEIRERKETGRIEAFSDGVFAIAITLLVLGIKVPKAGGPWFGLDNLPAPHYVAFVTVSFTILPCG